MCYSKACGGGRSALDAGVLGPQVASETALTTSAQVGRGPPPLGVLLAGEQKPGVTKHPLLNVTKKTQTSATRKPVQSRETLYPSLGI